jgi:L-galactonate dehydratase
MAPHRSIDVSDVEILSFTVTDLRFPTSLDGVGSDAMHVGTNGSHPYLRLQTDHDSLVGEGIVRLLRLFAVPYYA